MQRLQRAGALPWLAEGLALLGAMVATWQLWLYSHQQVSVLDEGNYLIKGVFFVQGEYRIYQDYGFWSNHMPLSFLIPGVVLNWFGPSLQTARLLAFVLGLITLTGIWIVARRWGGSWGGAFAVWAMAVNPAVLKIYSTMTSQVLVACLLAWVLVFVLAVERPLWQILAGAALAGTLLLTRENMIFVLPLLLLYIDWQHGHRAAIGAGVVMGAVTLWGFATYWPGILRVWVAWLPIGWLSLLDPLRAPEGIPLWDPQVDSWGRLFSFFLAIRYHFVAVIGVLASVLLWPRHADWRSESHRRASVFLVVMFAVLFLAHAWVTVGFNFDSNEAYSDSYCVFCFPVYLAFFSFIGILLIVIIAPSWRRDIPIWLQGFIAFLLLVILTGVGYSTFQTFGDEWLGWRVIQLEADQIQSGTISLKKFLQQQYQIDPKEARRLVPAMVGLLGGVAILLLAGAVHLLKPMRRFSWGAKSLVGLLALGFLLSPTLFFGAGYQNYDCGSDVIASQNQLDAYLAKTVPPGSLVYWQGGLSPVPLLAIPGVRIFPPQTNQDYTFHHSGEPDALQRYGFWNRELAETWLVEADYALIVTRYYQGWVQTYLDQSGTYRQIGQAPPAVLCEPDAFIRVFERVK